jgi:hypothetical protein
MEALEAAADDILELALNAERQATRRRYATMQVTHSLVPEPWATFYNKVKPGSLRSFVAVEAELRARSITGWTPHPNHAGFRLG